MVSTAKLHAALKKHFGFDTFKGQQQQIIQSLLNGQDTFVLMPTGGGKSLCYQLPAMLLEGTAIVISPLIALMKNQVDAMRNFSENDGVAHFLNSSLTRSAIDEVKKDIIAKRTKLLFVAPESLTKEEYIAFLKTVKISFYAVDEAHCISEWGHDFRPEYRRIRPIINAIGPGPVIALTATATPKVQHDIQKNLGMLSAKVFSSSFNRVNLYYEVRPKTAQTDKDIIRFIKSMAGKSGIIYCLSRKKVEELAEILVLNDIRALPYHAGMDGPTRTANQDAFLHEKADVIVATIAFGMGIDKPDVRFVLHYDIPKSLEGYYQETGRAGRDGGEGRCITFYSPRDLHKLEKFVQSKPVAEQEIGRQLLMEAAAYAESSVCRRKSLLHYFGEEYPSDNCGNCDNCLRKRNRIEATQELLIILDTIRALKERFKADHIIDVVRGFASADVRAYKHDTLENFGLCHDLSAKHLASVIRQAALAGYIIKDFENIGLLHLTERGEEFLKRPSNFNILEDRQYTDDCIAYDNDLSRAAGSSAMDPELYSILCSLRADIARKKNLPPYVIFQTTSLEAMSTSYPVNMSELANIQGVGTGKAHRYGQEFLDVIRRHVEEYDIVRPADMVVRTVANKSRAKIALIHAIDRQIPLDELAESKGINLCELMDEIETILNAGTKINISYYIDQILDEDQQSDIFEYFSESETGDLMEAWEEFKGEFSEDEVRLMRIKFISEMGY